MGREDLITQASQIDFGTISNVKDFVVVYDEKADTLFARPEQPRPATSIDWNGEIWVRVDPRSGEVVGLEVDDFEAFFIIKHPEIAQAWREAKVRVRKKTSNYKDDLWQSFESILLDFIQHYFNTTPQQAEFGIV